MIPATDNHNNFLDLGIIPRHWGEWQFVLALLLSLPPKHQFVISQHECNYWNIKIVKNNTVPMVVNEFLLLSEIFMKPATCLLANLCIRQNHAVYADYDELSGRWFAKLTVASPI